MQLIIMTLMPSITFAPAPLPQLTPMVAAKIIYNQLMEMLGSWMASWGYGYKTELDGNNYSFIHGKMVMTGNHPRDQRFQAVPYSSVLWGCRSGPSLEDTWNSGQWEVAWLIRVLEGEMLKGQFQWVLARDVGVDMWVWSHIVDIFVSHVNAHQRSPPWKQHLTPQ